MKEKLIFVNNCLKELIVDENLEKIQLKTFAYPDKFIEHGSVEQIERKYGQDVESIIREIEKNG